MKNSVLYPPNLQQLSDSVIFDVAHGSRHDSIFDKDTRGSSTSSALDIESNLSGGARQCVRLPPSIRAPKRFDSNALFASDSQRISQAPLSEAKTRQRPEATDVQSIMLRRARGRIYQGRHRVKKRRSEMELQTNIKALQEQIHQLNTDKLVISVGLGMNTTPWAVAAEYFRLFQHGAADEERPFTSASAACDAQVQQHFLRTTMSPDLSDGTMHGLETVIESWKFMSRCFDHIDMVPQRLENGPEDVLVADSKCRLTITENTLRLAFPHLLQGQEGSKFSHLTSNLVGQILVVQGTMYLRWDGEIGRMSSIVWQVDLVKPLLELLGNIEDVSCLFNSAQITPDCRQVIVEGL